jgi:hypothetical protein
MNANDKYIKKIIHEREALNGRWTVLYAYFVSNGLVRDNCDFVAMRPEIIEMINRLNKIDKFLLQQGMRWMIK